MRLSLFNVEKWDSNWSIDIIAVDTSNWCGSLLSIGKWLDEYTFDLFWLRALVRKLSHPLNPKEDV